MIIREFTMRFPFFMNFQWLVFLTMIGCLYFVITGCETTPEEDAVQQFTYEDIVYRLVDLESLARLPLKGERGEQFSSYDQRSIYDTDNDKYIMWDANHDGTYVLRHENGREVLAEMKGPGCIWRIWSATPQDGKVAIYLDGSEQPVIDIPFKDYFSGDTSPFNRDQLVYTASMGHNSYVPIPYQKSCKIVAEPGWGVYYHFTYSTFPEGTEVETLQLPLTDSQSQSLDKVNDMLGSRGPRAASSARDRTVTRKEYLHPGSTLIVAELDGPSAITSIQVKLDKPLAKDREVLTELVLAVRWDANKEYAVYAPLGAFFGTMPGLNYYRSYPMGIETDNTLYSNWYMPFGEKAELCIINTGDRKVPLEMIIDYRKIKSADKLGRFHAKWHRDQFLPEDPDRTIDWTILKTKGKGRYVGVALHIWNPLGNWWGEGDEKFFIDGEKFPSTFGTGSEDYFGYAWCRPELFERAFHNQTLCEGVSQGHISVNRWHIADNIPFQRSFDGYIEKYFPNDRPTHYDCVAYWYLSREGIDPYPPAETRRVKPVLSGKNLYNQKFCPMHEAVFVDYVDFTMATETAGAEILYTLDGSDPTEQSQLYVKPLRIDREILVKMRAFKKGMAPSIITSIALRPGDYMPPVDIQASQQGIAYEIYEGQWQQMPDFSRLTPIRTGMTDTMDHTLMSGKENFAIVFKGMLKIPASGIYKLTTISDDGSRIKINGEVVLDNDGLHSTFEKSSVVALQKGFYPIVVEFFEAHTDEYLDVFIEGASWPRQPIDSSIVYQATE